MAKSPKDQALRIFEPDPDAVYSIEITERLTQIPRRTIAVYVKHRLISPMVEQGGGMFFDEEAIRLLRRIEQLRTSYGVNLPGIKMILGLLEELEQRQVELRFRRGKLSEKGLAVAFGPWWFGRPIRASFLSRQFVHSPQPRCQRAPNAQGDKTR